jgi:hypothetical protein
MNTSTQKTKIITPREKNPKTVLDNMHKIVKVYYLEYSKIPKMFFMPHHKR